MREIDKPICDRRLALIAMGNSNRDYLNSNYDKDRATNVADEIWAINSTAFVLKCDMAVMMDDMQELEDRRPEYAERIKAELSDTPILTSRAYEDYPSIVQYPLDKVISKYQFRYLNGSVAYGLAYALYMGYKKIILYGCDYMYDHKPGVYERGRGCVEFWIAVGSILEEAEISVASSSTLMDSNGASYYGYREQPMFDVGKNEDGSLKLKFTGWKPAPEPEPEESPEDGKGIPVEDAREKDKKDVKK